MLAGNQHHYSQVAGYCTSRPGIVRQAVPAATATPTVCHLLRLEQATAQDLAHEYHRLYEALKLHFGNLIKLWDIAYPLFLQVYYDLYQCDSTAAAAFLDTTLLAARYDERASRQLGALRSWLQKCTQSELRQLCQSPATVAATAPICLTPCEEAQLCRAFEGAQSLQLACRAFQLVRRESQPTRQPSPLPQTQQAAAAASAALASAAALASEARRRVDQELRAQPELAALLAAADAAVSAPASALSSMTSSSASTAATAASLLTAPPVVWRAGLRHAAGAGLTCCAASVAASGGDHAPLLIAAGYDDSMIRLHCYALEASGASGSTSALARHCLRGHSGCPHALAFTASDKAGTMAGSHQQPPGYLVSAGEDARVFLWRLPDNVCSRDGGGSEASDEDVADIGSSGGESDMSEEEHEAEEEIVQPLVSYIGHNGPVWCCDTHPYNASLFATGSHDRSALLWCTDRQTPLRHLIGHVTDVDVVNFHPNGSLLATGGLDGTVRLWDLHSGRCVRLLASSAAGGAAGSRGGGISGSLMSLAASPDGQLLAVAGEDRHVRVYDLAAAKPLWDSRRHCDTVACLAWSPSGRQLASADVQRRLLVWPKQFAAAAGPLAADMQLDGLAVPMKLLWPDHRPLLAVGSADAALCPEEAAVPAEEDALVVNDYEDCDFKLGRDLH